MVSDQYIVVWRLGRATLSSSAGKGMGGRQLLVKTERSGGKQSRAISCRASLTFGE